MNEDAQSDGKAGRELAIQTSVAVLTAGAGLLGPDIGAVATAASPALAALFSRVLHPLGEHRIRHAAEVIEDAADAAGGPVEQLIEKALADERREELFARTLTIGQDTALREKRRALGRALAAGIAGDDAKIDEELLFIRAVADIDTPHIRLLAMLANERILPGVESGSVFFGAWSLATMAARDPGLGEAIPVLLATLESHGLVSTVQSSTPWQASRAGYEVTDVGRVLLDRLTAEGSGADEGEREDPQ